MEGLLKRAADPADDYYKLLGCDETATTEQIETEFKVLAKKYHPDKVHDSSQQDAAAEKFIQIEQARKVLVDKEMRAKYDQWRSGGFKMVVTFSEWLAIQPRVHTSVHWITTKKKTPSLPEPENKGNSSSSNKRETTETPDESPPLKKPRTHHSFAKSLTEFRRGSDESLKISKFRAYQV